MTVYIAHAISDERKSAYGGEAGDQTGREVLVAPWFKSTKGWIVLRPKDREEAHKIAYDARAAAENPNIGYDQKQRNTLFKAAAKVGYDCAKVTTPCECDCSSLVRVCLWYAGIKVKDFSTASEVKTLTATGKFLMFTDAATTDYPDLLMEGDILVTKVKGHTAVVLNGKEEPHVTLLGDANCDGELNSMDASLILRYLDGFADLTEQGKLNADYNRDGKITKEDAQAILEHLVGAQRIRVIRGSVYVREGDNKNTKMLGIAHRGDTFPFIEDAPTGWYKIEYKGREAYISNRSDLTVKEDV